MYYLTLLLWQSSSTPGTDPDSVEIRVVQDSEGTVQTPLVVELPVDVFTRPSHLRLALFPVVTPPRSSVRDLQAKASMARVLGSARLYAMTSEGREPTVAQLHELVDTCWRSSMVLSIVTRVGKGSWG
ncbi:hypothetical protein POM88_049628 [Heracleum sosnowskyi]|uniref:Uncharacterized protein n=1 Tax=Heracleum sosnowskyi TaxID=360622 RepID=A0AAD8M1Q9_9APIA|nr:hypothetical protein POM88_049628 [Heracleum sosnowskyi]